MSKLIWYNYLDEFLPFELVLWGSLKQSKLDRLELKGIMEQNRKCYQFQVKNRNARKRYEIRSKLTIKTAEPRH